MGKELLNNFVAWSAAAALRGLLPTVNRIPNVPQGSGALSNFVALLKTDRQRIGRGYQYEVTFSFEGNDRRLSMMCHKAAIPGYNVRTQVGKIYGLSYEIPVGVYQDPLWISFYADIDHLIPGLFMNDLRASNKALSMFPEETVNMRSSYSPKYKDDFKFTMDVNILEEGFKQVASYKCSDCFVKTVRQVPLGHAETGILELQVEIIYERIDFSASYGNNGLLPYNMQTAQEYSNAGDIVTGQSGIPISSPNQALLNLGDVPAVNQGIAAGQALAANAANIKSKLNV